MARESAVICDECGHRAVLDARAVPIGERAFVSLTAFYAEDVVICQECLPPKAREMVLAAVRRPTLNQRGALLGKLVNDELGDVPR